MQVPVTISQVEIGISVSFGHPSPSRVLHLCLKFATKDVSYNGFYDLEVDGEPLPQDNRIFHAEHDGDID